MEVDAGRVLYAYAEYSWTEERPGKGFAERVEESLKHAAAQWFGSTGESVAGSWGERRLLVRFKEWQVRSEASVLMRVGGKQEAVERLELFPGAGAAGRWIIGKQALVVRGSRGRPEAWFGSAFDVVGASPSIEVDAAKEFGEQVVGARAGDVG